QVEAVRLALGEIEVRRIHRGQYAAGGITSQQTAERRRSLEALVDGDLAAERADRVLDLDVVVVERNAESLQELRLEDHADRTGVCLLRREIRVTARSRVDQRQAVRRSGRLERIDQVAL